MKFYQLVILLVIIINLSACDKVNSLTTTDVSLVKNGTLEFDKSITVGQAIDKYRYFNKTEWKSIEEDNGRRIVQTTGYIDITKHPEINNNKTPDIKSAFFKFQFKINQDKTFELSWCGFGAEKTDGTKIDPEKTSNTLQCINTLKEFYANEVGDVASASTPEKDYCSDVRYSIRNAQTAMESFFADNQKYPRQLPDITNFEGNNVEGVTVEVLSVDDDTYTLKAFSSDCNKVMLATSSHTGITEELK